MHAETAGAGARTTTGPTTRARILEAANTLFYGQGIRATSADRIIDQVGITKVTFYRHFRTKGDLVVTYLEQQSSAEQDWMLSIVQDGDPLATLRAIAAGIGDASCQPAFRGCAFINAAAEFPDPEDPVRVAVDTHRAWLIDHFAALAAETGARDPRAVANQLMILRDGAMVNGYLSDGAAVAHSLEEAFIAVVAGDPSRS